MDKLKLICAVIALIALYIIVLFVGLPFMVAILGLALALVVMLTMLAACLLLFTKLLNVYFCNAVQSSCIAVY